MPGRSAAGRRRKRIAVFRASNAARLALFVRVCGVSFAADGLFRPSGSLCYRHTFATQSCEMEHCLPLSKVACGTLLRWHPAKRGVVGSSGSFSRCRCVSGRIAEYPGGVAVKLYVRRGEIAPSFSRSLPAIPPGSLWRTMHASEKKKGLIQKILALQKEVCYHFASLRPLAQLVEHDTFNVGVAGSIPARPTILAPCKLLAWGFFIVFSCRLNARFADIFSVTLRGL